MKLSSQKKKRKATKGTRQMALSFDGGVKNKRKKVETAKDVVGGGPQDRHKTRM